MANKAWNATQTPFPSPRLTRTMRGFFSGIAGGARSPVWPTFSMPSGIVNNPYVFIWDLAPASAPTTYTVVAGALPTGLALSNLTGDQGEISGTPTVIGVFTFTLRATNAYGTADKAFTITITAPATGMAYAFAN